jgi:hypothetical protein
MSETSPAAVFANHDRSSTCVGVHVDVCLPHLREVIYICGYTLLFQRTQ